MNNFNLPRPIFRMFFKLLVSLFFTSFSTLGYAIFGLTDPDFCKKNPNDLMCYIGVDDVVKDAINSSQNAIQNNSFSVPSFNNLINGLTGESNSNSSNEASGSKSYSIFYDQGDHLKELVGQEKFQEASELFRVYQQEFFEETSLIGEQKANIEKYTPELKQVSEYLNSQIYNPKFLKEIEKLKASSENIGNYNKWKIISSEIKSSQEILNSYRGHSLLGISEFSSRHASKLESGISNLHQKLKRAGSENLIRYGVDNIEGFFSVYPVKLDRSSIIRRAGEKIPSHFSSKSVEDIAEFSRGYLTYLSQNQKNKLGDIFLDAYSKENPSEQGVLSTVMNALIEAKKIGLEPESTGKIKVKFVEITSKTLLKEGQIEFPAEINMDLPFEIGKSDVKNIFEDNTDSDFIIVFDAALANVNRRIQKREKAGSKFLAGYNTEQNPAFLSVQIDVQNAQMGVQSASSQYCAPGAYSYLCELGKAIGIAAAQSKLKESQELLISTPQTLKKPIHKNYEFNTSELTVRKNLTANFYVVNLKKKTYFKDVVDISESKKFNISYDVKNSDINRTSIAKQYDSEEEISSYEEKAIDLDVSLILKQYLSNQAKEQALVSENELRLEMMYDKNQALESYKKATYDARPLNDARFDNVVVVYNPTGGLGSGFYITPDLVLTNYHVIEGAKFVEMKLYNGLETFGKVIKSDVRLDLALIKTQEKGKPVEFYDKNQLGLGSTVEAIGHPKSLEFTITRGVISAIREKPSIYDTGGKEVLFVQTDTPINPGNSGGPLFLGNKVIGVNDNKLVGEAVEGIAFSIHHSEVQKFLKEDF